MIDFGCRIVTKEGVNVHGATYWSSELDEIIGKPLRVGIDEADAGHVHLFDTRTGQFVARVPRVGENISPEIYPDHFAKGARQGTAGSREGSKVMTSETRTPRDTQLFGIDHTVEHSELKVVMRLQSVVIGGFKRNSEGTQIMEFHVVLSPDTQQAIDSLCSELSSLQNTVSELPEPGKLLFEPIVERFFGVFSKLCNDLIAVSSHCKGKNAESENAVNFAKSYRGSPEFVGVDFSADHRSKKA